MRLICMVWGSFGVFRTCTWLYVQGLPSVGFGNHIWCQGWNLGRHKARQAPNCYTLASRLYFIMWFPESNLGMNASISFFYFLKAYYCKRGSTLENLKTVLSLNKCYESMHNFERCSDPATPLILGPLTSFLLDFCLIQAFMSYTNHTGTFFLTGLPGLEDIHAWLSIPLCVMYVASLAGNSLILWVVRSEPSLHQPMYYFLSMLAVTDLGLSASTLPTMVIIYVLGVREVAVDACLAQLFFIHTFSIMESSVLLTMAFDRFVAISNPLRYGTILTNPRILSMGGAIVVRSVSLHIPAPIMLKKLPYCHNRLLSHSYCLHPDVMKLACADTHINSAYGLFVVLSTLGMDSVLIVLSYGLILHTVLSIASKAERLKALNTCVSHICAVLLFYTPMIGLSMIHRFGRRPSPCSRVLLSYLHFLTPPVLNPVVYTIKTKQIRLRLWRLFRRDSTGIRDTQDH